METAGLGQMPVDLQEVIDTDRDTRYHWWRFRNHNSYQLSGKIMAMTVEIKGSKLCIEIDLEEPTPSTSGKTLVVASTRGNAITTAKVNGKQVIIGLNAYIKP
jgi:hypothetical protein